MFLCAKRVVPALLCAVLMGQNVLAVQAATLKSGTPVIMRTVTSLSSKDGQVGQNLSLQVLNDVVDPETKLVLIRSGAPASATVNKVDRNGAAGKKGAISVTLNSVQAVDGAMVPLVSELNSEGQGKRGTAIGLAATSLIIWPMLFFIFKHGKDAMIPVGTQMTGYVANDALVDDPEKPAVKAVAATDPELQVEQPAKPAETMDFADQIIKLNDLYQKGLINQHQFEAKKKQLLGI